MKKSSVTSILFRSDYIGITAYSGHVVSGLIYIRKAIALKTLHTKDDVMFTKLACSYMYKCKKFKYVYNICITPIVTYWVQFVILCY